MYICRELLEELERVLTYPQLSKYGVNAPKVLRFIQEVGVMHELQYPIKRYIPEDSDDNYIVALALQTNSGFITSGDKHILSQKEILEEKFKKLKILTRSEFEERVFK
ncbi:MAG: putative toxin-antitoxin system toxin component, PIN family [Bacteroidetes bacterium]|nr:putative toxin-antitoxin system toxin component, PIN family [Bacteroidota bacterium]